MLFFLNYLLIYAKKKETEATIKKKLKFRSQKLALKEESLANKPSSTLTSASHQQPASNPTASIYSSNQNNKVATNVAINQPQHSLAKPSLMDRVRNFKRIILVGDYSFQKSKNSIIFFYILLFLSKRSDET